MRTRKIDFYHFSGTGNTLLVLEKMKDVFQQHSCEVRLFRIEQADPQQVNTENVLGLAFPVAAQSTYPFVLDFLDKLPAANGTEAFMVDTLAAFSGGIVGPLRKSLLKKGWTPIGAREIVMPSNLCLTKIDADKNKAKIEKGLKSAKDFAEQLLDGSAVWKPQFLSHYPFEWIARSSKVWKLMRGKLKNICAAEKCLKCGLCVKLCPIANISLDPTAIFSNKCVLCQRCLAFCPVNAISVEGKKYATYKTVNAEQLVSDSL